MDIINYSRMHASLRSQLEEIMLLLDALDSTDIAIFDFVMDALEIVENRYNDSTLSRVADVFEDGMCILDDLGFIKDDARIVERKLRSQALDDIDIKSLTQILTSWADAEVPHV